MKNSAFYIFSIAILISCNRDSNELPAPGYESKKVINKVAKLSGKDIAELTFRRSSNVLIPSTAISLKNISGKALKKLIVLVERCGKQADYENCRRQLTITGDVEIDASINLSTDEISFFEDNVNLNVYILNYEGANLKLPPMDGDVTGAYAPNDVVYKNANKEIIAYGQATGYILPDGTTIFHLKAAPKTGLSYYSARGVITKSGIYTGFLSSGTTTVTETGLSAEGVTTNKIVWRLAKPVDNISSIEVTLNN